MTTTPTSTTNAAAPAPTTPTIIYSNTARFPLGQIVATPGALELLQETGFSAAALISRHVHGDWGDLCDEDRAENDFAVTRRLRILSCYRLVDAAQGTVVLDATAGSDAGIDVVSSEYATIAAENTALERLSQILADQIVARVALFAERQTPDK